MMPFDRMIRMMDDWAIRQSGEDIFAQIGAGDFEPKRMSWQRIIPPDEYKKVVANSRLIVAHAGTGSVFTASEYRKPIVLVPRRAAQMEHTTDHQLDTAKWLEGKPGIFVAWTEADLPMQIERASQITSMCQSQIPVSAPQPFLDRIRTFLTT